VPVTDHETAHEAGSDSRPDEVAATVQGHQFVTFSVADELFAVPMAPVQEIIRVPEVARMPLTPAALDGLSNLRGRCCLHQPTRRLFNTAEPGQRRRQPARW